jgi:hypothetical protein
MTPDEIIEVMAQGDYEFENPDLTWAELIRRCNGNATLQYQSRIVRNRQKAVHAALAAKGLAILPEQREFICKKCHARTDEGKPENYHPF